MKTAAVPFSEALKDVSAGNTKIPQAEFLSDGPLAVVDQGQSLVAGFTADQRAAVRSAPPHIVFGDHTRAIKFIDFPFAMGADGVKVLQVQDGFDPKFVYHYLRSRQIPSAGYSRHFKFLKELAVPKPSLPEQRRIAAILDHADAIRANRRQVLAHLESMHEATFHDMFGTSRAAAVTTRPRQAHPEGWEWVLLGEVARLATGHTPDRKRADYWGGDISWISLPEIRRLDGRITDATELRVTEAGIANSSAVVLPAGTVCFSRTASVGFVTVMGAEMATSQDFHNWVPGELLRSEYLMAALRTSRRTLLGESDGSIHRTIYQRTAERFRVLLPPLAMQHEFAERIAALRCEQAAVELAGAADCELFESLSSRAFRGEL